MSTDQGLQEKLKPLNITCTSSDCQNGLHCFRQTQKISSSSQHGRCQVCGVELVDWSRVHRRDLADVAYTFATLKYEVIRHHYWHIEIDQKAVNHARRKGRLKMRLAVETRIQKYVGSAKPFRDGGQTPWAGNAIFYAQHATASCCRKCIEEWHGIPQSRELTEDEIVYLTTLGMLYIEERLPFLTLQGEEIPRMSRQRRNVSPGEF